MELHAYAMLRNHFHLLFKAPIGELSRAMRDVAGKYAHAFNHKYGFDGPLYRSRFLSVPILDERQLMTVFRYIHQNPIKGLEHFTLSDFRWTSHLSYAELMEVPSWLQVGELRTRFPSVSSYREFIEAGRTRETPMVLEPPAVRNHSLDQIEWALGVASPAERELLRTGGRGVRNDVRAAAILLGRELTCVEPETIASRYGVSSVDSLRAITSRARSRLTSDAEFNSVVEAARRRLTGLRYAA